MGRLTTPVLYLWGSEEPFATAEQARTLVAQSPSASIEHFGGFGHLLFFDDPELIAGRIRTFLGSRRTTNSR